MNVCLSGGRGPLRTRPASRRAFLVAVGTAFAVHSARARDKGKATAATPTPSDAPTGNSATAALAINKAARLQMLAERTAKHYLQIGRGVEAERSRRLLTESVEQFESTLVELRAQALGPVPSKTLATLEALWGPYRGAVTAAGFSAAPARRTMQAADELAARAGEVANALEDQAGSPSGHLVNVAGRMRMLSQRMARLFQMNVSGLGAGPDVALLDKTVAEFSWKTVPELSKANDEFKRASRELKTSLHTPNPVVRELELVDMQWLFFERAIAAPQGSDPAAQAKTVATTSERLLESLDRIVSSYEQAGR